MRSIRVSRTLPSEVVSKAFRMIHTLLQNVRPWSAYSEPFVHALQSWRPFSSRRLSPGGGMFDVLSRDMFDVR